MTKRQKKKIQKAKIKAEKITRKSNIQESRRIVRDKTKQVQKLKLPKPARKPKRKRTLYKVNKVKKPITITTEPKVIKKDFHVSGAYDNFAYGDKAITNRGISGALNRLAMKYPELNTKIQEFLEVVGQVNGIQELQEMFAEAYFDARETSLNYEEDLYAVDESGYQEFINMLDRRIQALKMREQYTTGFSWGG